MSVPIEELLPLPDDDDPDLEGVSQWTVPGSDVRVGTWVTAEGQDCWLATELTSDWQENGMAGSPSKAQAQALSSAMGRVADRIREAYWRRLIRQK